MHLQDRSCRLGTLWLMDRITNRSYTGFSPVTQNPEGDSLQLSPPYQQSYLIVVVGEDNTAAAFFLRDNMNVSHLRKSSTSSHHAASVNEFQSGIHSSKPPHYAELGLGLSAVQRERERERNRKRKRGIENERRSCCSIELCLTGRAQEV